MDRCWVSINYDWGDLGLPLAKTSNTKVLAAVKSVVLAEARERADISRSLDPIIATLDDAELKRLQDVLDRLVPEAEEGLGA